jgi:drug/metabolite transporter (DMT)-like permease
MVGLVSACIQSVGLTLQRKSHLLEEEREEDCGYIRRPPYRRRRWQLGMFMFLLANIVGSTIQITTLPLPVLSTLQASGLVFNTACATLLLDEPFTLFSVIGTVLVAAGAVLIALFGSMAEPSHNLDQLLALLAHPQFLVWLIGTFFAVGVILVAVIVQERLNPRPNHKTRLVIGLSYGILSGALSAHCLLLAKSAVELVVRTIVDGVNQFNRWQSWMILFGLVVLAISQLYFLHRGLKLCSTSVLYPFVFCIYNIIAILDGLIYFRQVSRIKTLHIILVALGTAILLAGVFALSWRLDPGYQIEGVETADSKAAARVSTPHTALVPGLGLVDGREPADEETAELDESTSSSQFRRPTEATPLLRSRTAPPLNFGLGRTTPRRRLPFLPHITAPRSPRARRLTTAGIAPNEAASRSDIWEQLTHDSSPAVTAGRRYSSGGGLSPLRERSPTLARGSNPSLVHNRARASPAAGFLSLRSSSARSDLLSRLPRWSKAVVGWGGESDAAAAEALAGPATDRAAHAPLLGDTDTDTDASDVEAGRSRGRWSLPNGNGESGRWLKLKWWKRWRRDEDQEGDG